MIRDNIRNDVNVMIDGESINNVKTMKITQYNPDKLHDLCYYTGDYLGSYHYKLFIRNGELCGTACDINSNLPYKINSTLVDGVRRLSFEQIEYSNSNQDKTLFSYHASPMVVYNGNIHYFLRNTYNNILYHYVWDYTTPITINMMNITNISDSGYNYNAAVVYNSTIYI